MEKPLVSVIIPAYNAEKYIEETLQSALGSTYKPLEIIVVNDGSTDDTQQIADKLASENPVIRTYHQFNKGASAARNTAISYSRGKYILPLDADDLISSVYIEKAVKILNENSDVKVVYGDAMFFGEKNGLWRLPKFDINLLARRNIIYSSGIYRRADFDKTGGYCEDIEGMEDWDFWISMMKNGGDISYLEEVVFFYRIISNSKRSQDLKKKKLIVDKLNLRHKEFFDIQLGGKLHHNRSWSKLLNKLGIKGL